MDNIITNLVLPLYHWIKGEYFMYIQCLILIYRSDSGKHIYLTQMLKLIFEKILE